MTTTVSGIPTGTFSMGTSSTVAPVSSDSKVDKSLDELIKERQKSEKQQQQRPSPKTRARSNNNNNNNNNKGNKKNAAEKSLVRGRDKRAAAFAARRGLRSSTRASTAESKRDNNRRRPSGRNTKNSSTAQPTRRSTRRGVTNNKREAEVQAKAKNRAKQQGQSGQRGGNLRPPTKKALDAAVSAMSNQGFKVPKGMQMVISFAPAPGGGRNNRRGRNN